MTSAALKIYRPVAAGPTDYWVALGVEDSATSRSYAVRQGFRPEVYYNLLDKSGLSQTEFHQITQIPLSTLKRRLSKHERFSSQESDVIYRLALLVKLAIDLFGDEQQARQWLAQSVYGLNGKRPLDMVATTVDFELVRDLIGRIEHGVFA